MRRGRVNRAGTGALTVPPAGTAPPIPKDSPMTSPFVKPLIVASLLLAAGNALAADRGDRVEQRFDRRGDRIDNRLDRKGDRIDERLDRRAEIAENHGHERRAAHFDDKGDRIENRLDHKGDRADNRWDRRGERFDRRWDHRH